MSETLGALCDKLTIVKLKQYHTQDEKRLESLLAQKQQLINEINVYVSDAVAGLIPPDKLTFEANKVFKETGCEIREMQGSFGETFAELAEINCKLWHEQEKVYEFETVPVDQKNSVVKSLAILNLERNKCIDNINDILKSSLEKNLK